MKYIVLLLTLLFSPFFMYEGFAQCTVTTTPSNNCYYGDAINSFTLNSISSIGNSGCSNTSTGYTSFTNPIWSLTQGQTYSFSVSVGTSSYSEGFAMWIDLNNNNVYESTEQMYASSGAGTSFSGSITIPSTATAANGIRMRLICAWNTSISSTQACSSGLGSGYGEIEDYYVNIVSACNVAFSAQPPNRSICAGSNTTFNVTAANANTYKWEVSTNAGTSWSTITNTGVYSGATTSTLTLTNVPLSMSSYQYRCTGTNTTAACSKISEVGILNVNAMPSITSTTPGAGCTGSATQVTAVPSTGATIEWYNQAANGTLLGTGNTLSIASAPASNTNYYAQPTIPVTPTSLSVQLSATNSNRGCFMDVVALKDINMTDISWIPATTQSYDISIYFKEGTSVGFETTSTAWTLLTTKTNISATSGTPNKITLPTAQTLSANNTYSILVIRSGSSGSIRYTTVSAVGDIGAQNSDIQFKASSGIGALFSGGLNTPRQFAGIIWYENAPCIASRTPVQVVVNGAPTITKQPTNTSVCEGGNLTLTTSVAGASTYAWEVSTNNGASWSTVNNGGIYTGATTQALTITGATAAIDGNQYRIKGSCTSTATSNAATVTIDVAPTISTQPVNTSVCSDGNTTIGCVASGSGTLTYQWEVSTNGGSSWAAVSASATYSDVTTTALAITGATTSLDGNLYRCVVKGACTPDATTSAATLTVNTAPDITTQPSAQSLCPGDDANFTCVVTGAGLTYKWQEFTTAWADISNGGIYSGATGNSLTLGSITPGLDGRMYRCVMSGTCSPNDTTNAVTLTVKATPTVTASSNSPVCEGDPLQLKAAGTGTGVSYSWSGPGSYGGNNQNETLSSPVVANTGLYTVTATLISSGCSVEDTVTATVKIRPVIPTVGSNSPVCTKYDINLTANSTTGSSYRWSGPAGFSSTNQNPVRANVTGSMGGYYVVDATIDGCTSAPDSTLVAILPSPNVGAFPSPGNTVCVGDTIIFTGIVSNAGTNPTYYWMNNGVDIPGANALVYKAGGLASGDIIKLRLEPGSDVTCKDPLFSVDIPAIIKPYLAPSVTITANPSTPVWPGLLVTFTATTNNAGNAPKYQWKRNGNNVEGATSSTWSATSLSDNDIVTCAIITDYLCPTVTTTSSNEIKVAVRTSVNNINKNAAFSLFPNPNRGTFTLKGEVTSSSVHVKILNALGQVVYENTFRPNDGTINEVINTGGIADGMYMLKISGASEDATIRFNVVN